MDTHSRRHFLAGSMATAGAAMLPASGAAARTVHPFSNEFIWGASTSSYQIEGNGVSSDIWLLEHAEPTLYRERSGDACDFLHRWEADLDLLKALGLKAFRFSFEWARIEPEPGQFSKAYLDHYRRIVDGCLDRGITPVTTFNHFSAPRWFASRNGWLHDEAPLLFARYCELVAKHMGDRLRYAVTINEPNIEHLLRWANLPPELQGLKRAMRASAAKMAGTQQFSAFTSILPEELDIFRDRLLAAHTAGRAAIRAHCPKAKIGVSIALSDDQAIGDPRQRDLKRQDVYEPWFAASAGDDFIGIQNYDRTVFSGGDILPHPNGATVNQLGAEVYAPSLGAAVRYAHERTKLPVFITEHGVATADDQVRSRFITESLNGLGTVVSEGVPVTGYLHWSIFDNFEWIFGFGPTFGLVAVDRATQRRTPKPSAMLLGQIATKNRV